MHAHTMHAMRPLKSGTQRAGRRTRDPDGVDDLRGQQVPAAAHEAAVGAHVAVLVRPVRVSDQVFVREEADREHAPRPVPSVHRDGVQRVIKLCAKTPVRHAV